MMYQYTFANLPEIEAIRYMDSTFNYAFCDRYQIDF